MAFVFKLLERWISSWFAQMNFIRYCGRDSEYTLIFNIIIPYMSRINFPQRILCTFLIDTTRAAFPADATPS